MFSFIRFSVAYRAPAKVWGSCMSLFYKILSLQLASSYCVCVRRGIGRFPTRIAMSNEYICTWRGGKKGLLFSRYLLRFWVRFRKTFRNISCTTIIIKTSVMFAKTLQYSPLHNLGMF